VPLDILIAEDHEIVAKAVAATLTQAPDLGARVRVAHDIPGALLLCEERPPQIAFVDLTFSRPWQGLELCRQIKHRWAQTRVIVYTGQTEPWVIQRSKDAGADAVVSKNDRWDAPVQAVRLVRLGRSYWSPSLVADELRADGQAPSEREQEVLELLAEGLGTEAIAERMGVGSETVRTLVKRLQRKLEASSRTHLVSIAFKRGLLY